MLIKRWHAYGFAHLASTTNQINAVVFQQRHRIVASTGCLITPPHLDLIGFIQNKFVFTFKNVITIKSNFKILLDRP